MKKSNKKVSIIIPMYNTERYLEKCIESLVNQTLEEIEIIVVNDGSTDESQKIIDKYAKLYPQKIRSFIKENGGQSSARNYGINVANGEYLAFIDSDDYVERDMFEKMYNKALGSKSDIVVCPMIKIYNNKVDKEYFKNINVFGKSVTESSSILAISGAFSCNKIFSTKMWKSHNFSYPEGIVFEDVSLIYNVLTCAKKIECINIPMYHYIKSRDTSTINVVDEKIFDVFKACDNIINFQKQNKTYDILESRLQNICITHIYVRYKALNNCGNKKIIKEFINRAFIYLNSNFPNWKKSKRFTTNTSFKGRIKNIVYTNKTLLYLNFTCSKSFKKKVSNLLSINKKLKISKPKRNMFGMTEAQVVARKKAIQTEGYKALSLVQKILNEIGVVYFADFGTLLGFIREKGFMSHDLDLDIGIIENQSQIELILRKMEENGFTLWREHTYNGVIVEHSFKKGNLKVDFNYYKSSGNHMKTWLFYKKPGFDYSDKHERHVVEMNYTNIGGTKQITLNRNKIKIPKNPEKLLEEKYGETWKIPNTDWIYWKSPAATQLDETEIFKQYKYINYAQKNFHDDYTKISN